jgi:hypothetical protein
MQATTGTYALTHVNDHPATHVHQHRYTYSLVFAADMYATVFKKDPLNPALGKRYRESILKVGGSREETESLEVGLLRHEPYVTSLTDHFRRISLVARRTRKLS